MFNKLFLSFLGVFLPLCSTFALSTADIGWGGLAPEGTAGASSGMTLIRLLSKVQEFLLKVVLPVVVIGSALYIAYQLFTAEGDETKMKHAWKSVTFSAIALIAVALSYALVGIISRISL